PAPTSPSTYGTSFVALATGCSRGAGPRVSAARSRCGYLPMLLKIRRGQVSAVAAAACSARAPARHTGRDGPARHVLGARVRGRRQQHLAVFLRDHTAVQEDHRTVIRFRADQAAEALS